VTQVTIVSPHEFDRLVRAEGQDPGARPTRRQVDAYHRRRITDIYARATVAAILAERGVPTHELSTNPAVCSRRGLAASIYTLARSMGATEEQLREAVDRAGRRAKLTADERGS
jgi:hypothetical protein